MCRLACSTYNYRGDKGPRHVMEEEYNVPPKINIVVSPRVALNLGVRCQKRKMFLQRRDNGQVALLEASKITREK